jgi:hypothetical protein
MKTKIATQTAQQGDVTLRKIEALPKGAAKIGADRVTLAEGEVTGHAHRIEQAGAELFDLNNRMFLKLASPATLLHEEHGPITLDAGVWEVGQVQEWDYLSQMARKVVD